MAEQRKIQTAEGEIVFFFFPKAVKNLNLRVRKDGTVHVSAPYRTPLSLVDAFVRANAGLILRGIARTREQGADHTLRAGDTVFFLGDAYLLCVKEGKAALAFEDGIAHLSLPRAEADLEGAYLALAGRMILPVLASRCAVMEDAHPLLRGKGRDIRVKRMRSMWANCRPKEGRLTFSSELAAMPLPLIDGVVAHEYAHFFHAGHGKEFYAFLATLSPDYKALSLALSRTKREQLQRRHQR